MASLQNFLMGFRFLAGTAAFVFPDRFFHHVYGRDEATAKVTPGQKLGDYSNIAIRMFAVRDFVLGYLLWECPSQGALYKALIAATISDVGDALASALGYQDGAITGLAASKAAALAGVLAAVQFWAALRAIQ